MLLAKFEEWERGYGSGYQRARGGHTLCGECNWWTGGTYAPAFIDWSRQGFARLHQTAGRTSMNYHGVIYPLRVLKQIATIFFATSAPEFGDKHPALRRFVLDKERTGLPPEFEFFVFWYGGGNFRQTGIAGVLNVERGSVNVLSEFVHPPFGYVLSLSGALHDRRPESITHFAKFSYNEAIEFNRRLPVLQTHWMMPGDYRTLEQIEQDQRIDALADSGVREPEEALEGLERVGRIADL